MLRDLRRFGGLPFAARLKKKKAPSLDNVVASVLRLRPLFLNVALLALSACAAPTPAATPSATLRVQASPPVPTATAMPTEPPTPTIEPTLAPTAPPVPEPFRVVGYVTAATVLETIQFDKLTHL